MNNAQAYEKASEYTAKYKGFKEYYLDTILRDTAAVTGLEGIRRIVGIAHVKDITSIQHEEKRTKAERLCMLASKRFIMKREELKTGKDFLEVIKQNKDKAVPEIIKFLKAEAHFIRDEDEKVCKAIGEYSLSLLKPEMGILTHCNAGTIATAKYGTALAPLYLGAEKGYNFKVFADETRPLLQGARLTAWELNEAGIDVTLICDNMASIVMKNGWIDAVVVGCDRVAYNGDTANKIGTSGVAILAKEYGIPLYVHAPLSTIDLNTKTGKDIHIELRPGEEIYKTWYEKPMAPEGIKTYNPAFDVTDAKYITAIITEKGIAYPPYEESLPKLFDK